MSDTKRTLALSLELEMGTEPITGTVHHPDGARHPFHGWIALASLLEQARDGNVVASPLEPPHLTPPDKK